MTISVLVHGTLRTTPESHVSAKGNTYVRARLTSHDGDIKTPVGVIAFDGAADQLLQLKEGDGVSIAGAAQAKTFTNKSGDPVATLDVVVDRLIAVKPLRAGKNSDGERYHALDDIETDIPF